MIDFSHLSPLERLDLIGEIWDSLDATTVAVTPAQKAEIRWRLVTLDEDIRQGRDADEVLDGLRHLHG